MATSATTPSASTPTATCPRMTRALPLAIAPVEGPFDSRPRPIGQAWLDHPSSSWPRGTITHFCSTTAILSLLMSRLVGQPAMGRPGDPGMGKLAMAVYTNQPPPCSSTAATA